ncbi:flagellar motor switch protein FliN [Mangrovibacter plantisponsor]|uniref:Flagellar motor switch protein FliN n=1 Tax=Mangrovibacter plantisponsor TaxID=451513 RepID=A0A317PK07_9ENTR|nr:flagellar motor switch protein FliN [Mangrovibacter plantisponsor]PWW00838.1 flagellar motor switch protein FliN/FliY [Mangrovibacter plantisponsor]
MTDLENGLEMPLDFSDIDLGELPMEDRVEGNLRLDLQGQEPVADNMAQRRKMALFSRIPVTLTLEVASVDVTLADLMEVDGNSVIELDKLAGDPLDIKVNGIPFGKAEVVVINDKYGLRIVEFNSHDLGELAS